MFSSVRIVFGAVGDDWQGNQRFPVCLYFDRVRAQRQADLLNSFDATRIYSVVEFHVQDF